MYVYGMMMGLNINDLVAFMTSPVSELIDQLANPNMFQNESGNAAMAINLAQGIVGVSKFLHGKISTVREDIETGQQDTVWVNKNKYVADALKSSDIYDLIKQNAGLSEEEDISGLGNIMQAYINYAITNQDVDLTELIDSNDVEVNSYLRYCQDLTDKLRLTQTLEEIQKNLKTYITMPLKFQQFHQLGQDLTRDCLLLNQTYSPD